MSQTIVLLVTDIPDHASAYVSALQRNGYDVALARTGDEALQARQRVRPACAIIDLRLPDVSGWDLCRALREAAAPQPIRIIVLTAEMSAECATHSVRVGCHAWLAQPVAGDELAATVRRVLALDVDGPASPEQAVLGAMTCAACGAEGAKATVRIGNVQYYVCQRCRFLWRTELGGDVGGRRVS